MYSSMAAQRDPNTLSNYGAWRTQHTLVDLTVDFAAQQLTGSVGLKLESLTDGKSGEIVLDTSGGLEVEEVRLDGAPAAFALRDAVPPYGRPLHVVVASGYGALRGAVVALDVVFRTAPACPGLQWLTPAQTGNKAHPYVYSQCQAILARSILPCQDTPDVKSTYVLNIASPLPVVASGVPEQPACKNPRGDWDFVFRQQVPIPSYLFALASGDLATAPIGRRSVVVTGPEAVDAARWELEHDMDRFLDVAERLVFDYQWGQYNVLVLPPSFAYGGEFRRRRSLALSLWPSAPTGLSDLTTKNA